MIYLPHDYTDYKLVECLAVHLHMEATELAQSYDHVWRMYNIYGGELEDEQS